MYRVKVTSVQSANRFDDAGVFVLEAAITSLLADSRLHLKRADSVAGPQSFSTQKNDDAFPGLAAGHIHEWHLCDALSQPKLWFPPLTLLALLACSRTDDRIVWVGRKCWPTFQLLCAHFAGETRQKILSRSTFLDPLTDAERFWSIAEGLRCPGVGCVVADGCGMSSTVNRRMQLAAESGRGVGLLARPPWEISEPFCAGTRWRVQSLDSASDEPQWQIELQRCRGQRQDAPTRWTVGWNYQVFVGKGALHFSPDVGCGSLPSQDVTPNRIKTA